MSCIRHSEQLSDRGGVHEEGYAVIGIGFLFQLSGAPDTTHKLNPGVSFRVADSQDRSEDAGLKDGDVKTCDGVVGPVLGADPEQILASVQIHSDLSLGGRPDDLCLFLPCPVSVPGSAGRDDFADLLYFFQKFSWSIAVQIVD